MRRITEGEKMVGIMLVLIVLITVLAVSAVNSALEAAGQFVSCMAEEDTSTFICLDRDIE